MKTDCSTKGFIAVDIDGTALVQKIDQNTSYALINRQVNIRRALISYIRAAIEKNFDILMLTARPGLCEPFLSMLLGTHSTQLLMDKLIAKGITISNVERAIRKGPKMIQILQQYPESAVGILFDDKLSQVNSVKNLNHPQLYAIDINSWEHLEQFGRLISHSLGDFSPSKIINRILTSTPASDASCNLQLLNKHTQQSHLKMSDTEIKLINSILMDLCLKLYEPETHNYQPDVKWISETAVVLISLIEKKVNMPSLSACEITSACKIIFSTKNIHRVKATNTCERKIVRLLHLIT